MKPRSRSSSLGGAHPDGALWCSTVDEQLRNGGIAHLIKHLQDQFSLCLDPARAPVTAKRARPDIALLAFQSPPAAHAGSADAKLGNERLRSLLAVGAMAVIRFAKPDIKTASAWLLKSLER